MSLKSKLSKIHAHLKTNITPLITAAHEAGSVVAIQEFIKKLNENYSSDLSKAMDFTYLKEGIGTVIDGIKMTANNHRIMDGGHTLTESLDRAFELGQENGWSNVESFTEWAKAYFTDLSSSAGMPAVPMADFIYGFLRNTLGLSEETARDIVTINGEEAFQSLFSGTITVLAIVFAWNSKDKETFSRSVGAIGVTSLMSLNPVSLVMTIAALGIGYNSKMIERKTILNSGAVSAAAFAISAIIPGPIIVGAIPAVVFSIYANKKMKDVDIEKTLKAVIEAIRSPEFKERLAEVSKLFPDVTKKAA